MVNLLLLILFLIGAISIIRRLPGGCEGDCQQGKFPCNCKLKEINVRK